MNSYLISPWPELQKLIKTLWAELLTCRVNRRIVQCHFETTHSRSHDLKNKCHYSMCVYTDVTASSSDSSVGGVDSEGAVVRAQHCITPGCEFESSLNLCLWGLFPLTDVPQQYVSGVTSTEGKRINSVEFYFYSPSHCDLSKNPVIQSFTIIHSFSH